MIRATVLGAICLFGGAAMASAQDTAGGSWSNGYSFPTANDRVARMNMVDIIAKTENGFYDTVGQTTYNTYNNYDHSVGSISVAAEAGSTVDASVRTAEGSGTTTYVVGAVNTSNNTVQVSGEGNLVDISNTASSTGCQDGRIAITGSTVGSGSALADITGASSAMASIGANNC